MLCSCGDNLPQYEHTYSNDFKYNDLEHWHPATCGHNLAKDREGHSFVASEDGEGHVTYSCDVCGYSETTFANAAEGYYDNVTDTTDEEKIKIVSLLENYVAVNHMISPCLTDNRTGLNYNTCDQDTWEYLFGENGTICQTKKDDYWQVKPIMHNSSFLEGINYCLDHQKYAEIYGDICKKDNICFLDDTHLFETSDNEYTSLNYNSSEDHLSVVKKYVDGTDGYGFSLEKAKALFKKASEDLINEGKYKVGDKIELELTYYKDKKYQLNNVEAMNLTKQNIIESFNGCGGGLSLSITDWENENGVWSDAFYYKMMKGQYDIGFGMIGGGVFYNCARLLTLKSDGSYFTLNWGTMTNEVSELLCYKKQLFSYDALIDSLIGETYVYHGREAKTYIDDVFFEYTVEDNGDLIIEICPASNRYSDEYFYSISEIQLIGREIINGSWTKVNHSEVKTLNERNLINNLYVIKFSKQEIELILQDIQKRYASVDMIISFDGEWRGLRYLKDYYFDQVIDIVDDYIHDSAETLI